MAGTAAVPTAAGSPAGFLLQQQQQQLSASAVNSFRVAAVADRLAAHLRGGGSGNVTDFYKLCLALSRGIDYAVANAEVPSTAKDLPVLLKQICQHKHIAVLNAGIMVLMASVKNACITGWFSEKENQELLALANEIGSIFCSSGDLNIPVNYSIISKIMARFYPLMSIGKILASLEVKPGYGTYVIDFHISKSTPHSPQEKIRLFVAQTDNIETSACIISPQLVNFLLNGKAVERRTNVFMDSGPQMATNVTPLLKYGTNLLQAVGQFNAHYIILVAFTSVKSPVSPVIPDYVQHGVAAQDVDSDIIEGPSRISLNCPISYKRIKTPVKGHSCKHLQCFDFDNFVDINSRRPSWRCPHCNRPVCYTDIRLDQNMAKVLREVGNDVSDIIISADGSWKAVFETDEPVDQALDETVNLQSESTERKKSTISSNNLPVILDLTGDDDMMDVTGGTETEDRKPVIADIQIQSDAIDLSMPSGSNNAIEVNHSAIPQIEDDFWSGLAPNVFEDLIARPDAQIVRSISQPTTANLMSSSVSTDAVSPAFNRGAEGLISNSLANSLMQNQFSTVQLQQLQLMNQAINRECARSTAIPQNVSRIPIAVQALPVPSQTPSPQQRPRSSLNTTVPNGSSVASQPAFSPVSLNPPSSQPCHSAKQNWNHQRQHPAGPPASGQLQGAYRAEHQNLHRQQALNQMVRGQPPSMVRPSSPVPRIPMQQGDTQVGIGHTAGTGNTQHNRYAFASQQPVSGQLPPIPGVGQTSRSGGPPYPVNANMARAPAVEQRGNMGGAVPTVELPSDQNWRPAVRMRGSLSGRTYSAALSQLIIQPTQSTPPNQPTQAVRLPLNASSSTSPTVPSLQTLLANSRATNFSPPQR